MGNKPISFKDKDGNFVSAADVWNGLPSNLTNYVKSV